MMRGPGPLLILCALVLSGSAATPSQTLEPWCPAEVINADLLGMSVQLGLAGYSFDEVFGNSADEMAAQGLECSSVCDGSGSEDSMQCSGPHACGKRTCLMNYDKRTPMACPAEAPLPSDTEAEVEAKVQQDCVPCGECVGRGCAKELLSTFVLRQSDIRLDDKDL